jgi:Cof subfamily protein (haloacid dehalogenase superfamily)
MRMYSIDLIALDLDGTLVDDDGNVSPGNRRAVRAAVNAGVRVALVTGRGADLPARLVHELRLNVPSICAHGALTKDFPSGRTIDHIPVPLQHAVALLEYAERRGFDAAVYSEERFLRAHGAPLHMDDMRLPHWHAVTSLREAVSTPPTFLRFFGSEAVAEIRSTFAHLPLHFKHEVFGDLEECAVTSAEATKEIALARLCAGLQIAPERVLAIGDSRNDVPMLRWAGVGVAMGNALPEIRREVGLVTGDCRDDGAAEAIRRYALRDVPSALSA